MTDYLLPKPGAASLEEGLAEDALRVRSALDEAKAFLDLLAAGATKRIFGLEQTRNLISRFDVIDIEGICRAAAKAAAIDRVQYSESYGRFIGSLEGLGQTLATLSERWEHALQGDELREAAASVLERQLSSLDSALTRVSQVTAGIVGETLVRERVAEFEAELSSLRSHVTQAASELGFDVRTLGWGVYADREEKSAARWRLCTVIAVICTSILALAALAHLLGDTTKWPEFALKVTAGLSLAGLAGYAASQASDHRTEAKFARHKALDYATLRLFATDLPTDTREAVLRQFGLTQFGVDRVSDTDSIKPNRLVDQIVQQIFTVAKDRLDSTNKI